MTRPARILVYNGSFVADHADREVPFVEELRRRGYIVDYVLGGGRLTAEARGHPRDIQRRGRLARISAAYCTSLAHLEFLIARSDVVLMGMFKGTATVAEIAKRYGKIVGRFDQIVEYSVNADFVAVAGPFFKEQLLEYNPAIDRSDVFVTGSLRFDRAQWPEVQGQSRDEFCALYDCDPSRKIALFLTTSPEAMDEWYVAHFRQVCDAVAANPDYTLVIKPHPSDYVRRRSHRLGRRHSWDVLAPAARVVRPEHGYQSFRHCDVGIAIGSDVSYEFALFRRPIVFIDSNGWQRQRDSLDRLPHLRPWWPYVVPSWVGIDCRSDQLAEVLRSGAYRVTDQGEYDRHIAKYCVSDDGRAYQRLADVVDHVIERRLSSGRTRFVYWPYARSVAARVFRRLRAIGR